MAKHSVIPAVTTPTEGSFQGHPTLTLPDPDDPKQPGVCLGVKKLRAVITNLDACQAFVDKHYKPKAVDPAVKAAEEKVDKLTALLTKLGGLTEAQIKAALT